jgi:hypothetical protein
MHTLRFARAKIFPLFHRHAETERSLFTLAFLVGLGFGISEFFVYVGVGVPVVIRLLGMFFHAASTSITAYGIARGQIEKYYLMAVFLHSMNNLFAELGVLWLIGGLGATLMAYYLSWRFYNSTSKTFVV